MALRPVTMAQHSMRGKTMSRIISFIFVSLSLACVTAPAKAVIYSTHASEKISAVYACGTNAVVITLSDGAHLWIYLPDVGGEQMDRMYAVALQLLASQRYVGYYDGNGSSARTNCGYTDLQEITMLEAATVAPVDSTSL
jgi:hypothetical protein